MFKPLSALIGFVLLFTSYSFSQNEANIWYFGNNAGIDFNPAVPVPLTNGALNTFEGCASIADKTTGQLLFYTDGNTVWNRNHVAMLNGTGLLGSFSATQSAIIVPRPGSNRYFYIFTVDDIAGPDGCRYTEVDMNLAGGLGGITSVKNQLLFTPGTEKIASACHGNGTDYWMITHGYGNNNFYAYQISAAGINTTPVTSSVGAVHGGNVHHTLGELEVSPDGSRIALCTWYGTLLQVFDFNDNTGVVSNPITLPSTGEEYGCAFSPDGSKVYYASCCVSPNDVVQFDLNAGSAAAIAASKVVVWNGSPSTGKGTLQNGPDGRIYVAPFTQGSLDVITNPNAAGLACGYVYQGFPLGGRTSEIGLPNMVTCLITVVLDAEFQAFYGDITSDAEVLLHWETVEQGRQGVYEVERSPDGAYFYTIGEVPFAENRPETAQLRFLDRNPLPDKNFYRVRVTDPNGEITVSQVIELAPSTDLQTAITFLPNPARHHVTLSLSIPALEAGNWRIKLYAPDGHLIRDQKLGYFPAGSHRIPLDISSLKPGIYFTEIQNGFQKTKSKLVITD